MKHIIKLLPSNIDFECSSDKTILDSAIEQGIVLEHSCKNGACNACQARVLDSQGKELTTILTCQVKPDCDMVLEAEYYPELAHIKSKTMPCKVDSVKYPHKDIAVIKLRLPPAANFLFLSGQYLDLKFQGLTRSYSIASVPQENGKIELHLKRVINGMMSGKLFEKVSANQLMQLEGPKGTFFYREDMRTGPLIFLATGTGFAPIKAIVTELISKGIQRNIYVYWGNRESALFYDDVFEQWKQEHANIKCSFVLSRPEADWTGKQGYVQEFAIADNNDLTQASVYACGSQSMIESAKLLMVEKGLSAKHFYSDAFVASS